MYWKIEPIPIKVRAKKSSVEVNQGAYAEVIKVIKEWKLSYLSL